MFLEQSIFGMFILFLSPWSFLSLILSFMLPQYSSYMKENQSVIQNIQFYVAVLSNFLDGHYHLPNWKHINPSSTEEILNKPELSLSPS